MEYKFSLSPKNSVNNEQAPLESKCTSLDATIQNNLNICGAVQNENTSAFGDQKRCAQINLKSRLAQREKQRDATFDGAIADRTKTIAKMDKIVLPLLTLELSGGKFRRAQQII